MALCMIYPHSKGLSTHFCILFHLQTLPLSIPFILTSDLGILEIEKNLRFLYSPHTYLLTLCKLVGFTLWGEDHWHLPKDARGTDDSRVIMTARQASQGPLQLHALHWSRHHHNLLVSLSLPRQMHLQGVYVNSTWLSRAWHTAWPQAGGPC